MKKINGKWLILMASILFGTTGTAQAFAPAGASPLTVGAVRMVVGKGRGPCRGKGLSRTGCTEQYGGH
ncbi:MAG TPA: hypothetical protein GX534_08755 [Thermoanaerobacterales bacterium]|nr:hypothetical protein [Thermoanaerobacterales bacterium]